MSEWLIHQHNLRLIAIGSCNTDTLSHTSGKLRRIAFFKTAQAYKVYVMLCRFTPRFFVLPSHSWTELYISHYTKPRKQGRFLINHSSFGCRFCYLFAVFYNLSARCSFKSCKYIYKSSLSALSRSEKYQKFIFLNRKTYIPQNLGLSALVISIKLL